MTINPALIRNMRYELDKHSNDFSLRVWRHELIQVLDELDRLRSLLAQEMDIEALDNVSSGEVMDG